MRGLAAFTVPGVADGDLGGDRQRSRDAGRHGRDGQRAAVARGW